MEIEAHMNQLADVSTSLVEHQASFFFILTIFFSITFYNITTISSLLAKISILKKSGERIHELSQLGIVPADITAAVGANSNIDLELLGLGSNLLVHNQYIAILGFISLSYLALARLVPTKYLFLILLYPLVLLAVPYVLPFSLGTASPAVAGTAVVETAGAGTAAVAGTAGAAATA